MNTSQIAEKLLSDLKTEMGAEWDKLKAQDQQLVTACINDAAQLTVAQISAPSAEAAQITAQLANIGAGAAADVAGVFWKVVQVAVSAGITVALGSL